MIRKVLNLMLVVAVVMLVAACAPKQSSESAPPAETPAAEQAPPMSSGPIELTPEKVTELAQMAVHMEKNPTMASEMLAQHGMTQEQVQEAMTRVAADTTLSAMFMQAKEAAMAASASEPATPAPAATEAGH